jgi:hypothetical protein
MAATCVSKIGSGINFAFSQILARGVEDLDHLFVRHQVEKRLEAQALGQRVDDRLPLGAGDLDQAEFRPESLFPHEFGIDGHEGVARQFLAESLKTLCGCNYFHRYSLHHLI